MYTVVCKRSTFTVLSLLYEDIAIGLPYVCIVWSKCFEVAFDNFYTQPLWLNNIFSKKLKSQGIMAGYSNATSKRFDSIVLYLLFVMIRYLPTFFLQFLVCMQPFFVSLRNNALFYVCKEKLLFCLSGFFFPHKRFFESE